MCMLSRGTKPEQRKAVDWLAADIMVQEGLSQPLLYNRHALRK